MFHFGNTSGEEENPELDTMRTQPIAIARTHSHIQQHSLHHSDRQHHRHSLGAHDSSDSEQGDENEAKMFFCESLNELNTNMGALTVGSLPSSRRERRFLVSTGTNESIYSRQNNTGGDAYPSGGKTGGGIGGAIARSMPPPRAPFLSSRRESEERLENMPIMDLPESATEYRDPFKGTPTVMPYGSLRESRFHQRRVHDHSQQLHRVRFDLNRNSVESRSGGNDPGALPSSYTGDAFYPQSLPVNKFEQNIIQKRWERINSRDKMEFIDTNDIPESGNSKSISGIGSLLEVSSEGSETEHVKLKKPVGNLSSQLEGNNIGLITIPATKEYEVNRERFPYSVTGVKNSRAGIGHCLKEDESTLISGLENTSKNSLNSKRSNQQHNFDDTFSLSHETDFSNPYGFQGTINSSSSILGHDLISNDPTNDLSSSLTGLDILESSRTSPGGLGINLTKAEKDGLMTRANTCSDDGTKILIGTDHYLSSTSQSPGNAVMPERSRHFHSQNLIPPANFGGPNLLAPTNNHDYSNKNTVFEDSLNRSSSPENPDTEGAFDLDFE